MSELFGTMLRQQLPSAVKDGFDACSQALVQTSLDRCDRAGAVGSALRRRATELYGRLYAASPDSDITATLVQANDLRREVIAFAAHKLAESCVVRLEMPLNEQRRKELLIEAAGGVRAGVPVHLHYDYPTNPVVSEWFKFSIERLAGQNSSTLSFSEAWVPGISRAPLTYQLLTTVALPMQKLHAELHDDGAWLVKSQWRNAPEDVVLQQLAIGLRTVGLSERRIESAQHLRFDPIRFFQQATSRDCSAVQLGDRDGNPMFTVSYPAR